MSGLDLYTITCRPRDLPGVVFAVRRFRATGAGVLPCELVGTADVLWEARKLVPPGLVRISAGRGEDPVIVETWL
jgi:hypothetical protein